MRFVFVFLFFRLRDEKKIEAEEQLCCSSCSKKIEQLLQLLLLLVLHTYCCSCTQLLQLAQLLQLHPAAAVGVAHKCKLRKAGAQRMGSFRVANKLTERSG